MTDYRESFARQDREVQDLIDAWLGRLAWIALPVLIALDLWRQFG